MQISINHFITQSVLPITLEGSVSSTHPNSGHTSDLVSGIPFRDTWAFFNRCSGVNPNTFRVLVNLEAQ